MYNLLWLEKRFSTMDYNKWSLILARCLAKEKKMKELKELQKVFNGLSRSDVLDPMFNKLDEFYNQFFNDFQLDLSKSSFPKLDAYEKDGKWIVEVAVSGVDKEDLNVEVLPPSGEKQRVIKISGQVNKKHQHQSDTNYVIRELRRSKFERFVGLPSRVNVDSYSAVLENGILTLTWDMMKESSSERRMLKIQ